MFRAFFHKDFLSEFQRAEKKHPVPVNSSLAASSSGVKKRNTAESDQGSGATTVYSVTTSSFVDSGDWDCAGVLPHVYHHQVYLLGAVMVRKGWTRVVWWRAWTSCSST